MDFSEYEKGNYEKAISYFQKSLLVNPNYTHTLFNLACAYSIAGRDFTVGKPVLQHLLNVFSNNISAKEKYIEKISIDSDLDFWRNSSDYINWFSQLN